MSQQNVHATKLKQQKSISLGSGPEVRVPVWSGSGEGSLSGSQIDSDGCQQLFAMSSDNRESMSCVPLPVLRWTLILTWGPHPHELI